MPISERDWWKSSAAWMYEPDEIVEERDVARPSIAWTLWQLVVLVFLGAAILALLVELFEA